MTWPLTATKQLTHDDYTVAWICALPIEKSAARNMLDELHSSPPQSDHDKNIYTFGCIRGHNVVIVCQGDMGITAASIVATRMDATFRKLRFGLLVGIAGGVPDERDVRLGDVVVSKGDGRSGGVVVHDRGKYKPEGFEPRSFLNGVPELLRNAFSELESLLMDQDTKITQYISQATIRNPRFVDFGRPETRVDRLFKADYQHVNPDDKVCAECKNDYVISRNYREGPLVHFGIVASGNQVIKDGVKRREILQAHPGVIAAEMEAAGLMNVFGCATIRGICDYADSHKNDSWQKYASAVAAGAAREILDIIPPPIVVAASAVTVAEPVTSADATFLIHFPRDHKFIGREDILYQIEERLRVRRRVSLAGIGGVGKSQIAIEFTYRFREKNPQSHVFWVYAANHARFDQAYQDILNKLDIPGRDDPKANRLKLVSDWLNDKVHGNWLMILDNADNKSLYFPTISTDTSYDTVVQPYLTDYLPSSSIKHGNLVITTRNRDLGMDLADGEEPIDVLPFTPEDGKQLLKSRLRTNSWDVAAAENLLNVLGYIPLAITQAAAYMTKRRLQIKRYLEALSDSDSNLAEYLTTELLDPRRQRGTPSSVFLTWKLSFDQISKDEPQAAEMLSLMAFLDRQGIPEMLLRQKKHLDVKETDAIGTLLAFSLIMAGSDDDTYSMHRLVQLSTQNWLLLQGKRDLWEEKALDLLSRNFPRGSYENTAKCITLLPHAKAVLNHTPVSNPSLLRRMALLFRLAELDFSQGNYKQAVIYCEESYSEQKRTLGPESQLTSCSLNLLALLYLRQGRWEEAETLWLQDLETVKAVLGTEHPDTLTSIANLASTYMNQGRWKEAEELGLQVSEASKRILGPEHPNTLARIANLASTYSNQGRWKEAEELDLQVSEASKRVLGPEHPDTLTSIANLVSIYLNQGRWKEAEELGLQVSEADKRVLGPEHPNTLASMANLASTYSNQGRWKEAEELDLQVLEARKRVLGPEHPNTLLSMANLASTYSNQGRWKEAEELDLQVLEARKRVLGPEHPDTLTSIANLVSIYWNQGRWKEAEELGLQVLEARKRVLGPEHPNTLNSMANLASTYHSQNHKTQAIELMECALSGRKATIGDQHPRTLKSSKTLRKWKREIG